MPIALFIERFRNLSGGPPEEGPQMRPPLGPPGGVWGPRKWKKRGKKGEKKVTPTGPPLRPCASVWRLRNGTPNVKKVKKRGKKRSETGSQRGGPGGGPWGGPGGGLDHFLGGYTLYIQNFWGGPDRGPGTPYRSYDRYIDQRSIRHRSRSMFNNSFSMRDAKTLSPTVSTSVDEKC